MIDLAQHRKPRRALLTPRSEDMQVVVDAQLRSRRGTLVHIRVQASQMRAGVITLAQASKRFTDAAESIAHLMRSHSQVR